jgi:hypothetical protein
MAASCSVSASFAHTLFGRGTSPNDTVNRTMTTSFEVDLTSNIGKSERPIDGEDVMTPIER